MSDRRETKGDEWTDWGDSDSQESFENPDAPLSINWKHLEGEQCSSRTFSFPAVSNGSPSQVIEPGFQHKKSEGLECIRFPPSKSVLFLQKYLKIQL